MRKNTILLLLALAVLAVSCDGIPEIPVITGEGIVLTLDTGGMALTKSNAGTRDGVDAFNENLLGSTVDVFFFPEDAGDNEPSVWNKRVAVSNRMLQIPVSIGDISNIFHGTVSGSKASVLVVANYDGPEAIDHENHYTKAQLKGLALARADWSQHPQDDFVFFSDETILTLEDASSSTPASGVVKMRRVAAKVSFRLTIADEIAVENYVYDPSDGSMTKQIEIWEPKTDAMTIYPQYFMKDATLGGTPTHVPTELNSPQLYTGVDTPYMLARTTETIDRSRTLFVKENGQYVQNTDGSYQTYQATVSVPVYKTMYAEYTTVHNDVTGKDEVVATMTDSEGPFYSYPVTWDSGVQTEPFLKLIIPWSSKGSGTSRTKYYYYKIPFSVEALEANNWYEVTLDVQILGGEAELPVPLDANYHVVDWVTGATGSTSATSARYLSVPTKSFTLYNSDDLEIPMISSHECEIVNVTVKQPNYSTNKETWRTILDDVTMSDAANSGFTLSFDGLDAIDFHHELNNTIGDDLDCTPYTITFRVRQKGTNYQDQYFADVTIIQYPAIYISSRPGGNVFIDGYFGSLAAWPTYFTYRSGTTVRSIGYNNNDYQASNNNAIYTPYGRLTNTVGNTDITNLTRVTVTSFSDDSRKYTIKRRDENTGTDNVEERDYIIGDPRVPSGWTSNDLVPYLSNMTNNYNNTQGARSTDWGDMASQIKTGTLEPNFIAPSFYIVSYWTRPTDSANPRITFEMAQKRCATLQEAGLPAGRWRLPTEAEVYFCTQLQIHGHIPRLFTSSGNQGYYASSGYAYYTATSDESGHRYWWWANHYTGNGGISVRCVYDVWYWGEDAHDPASDYYPAPNRLAN